MQVGPLLSLGILVLSFILELPTTMQVQESFRKGKRGLNFFYSTLFIPFLCLQVKTILILMVKHFIYSISSYKTKSIFPTYCSYMVKKSVLKYLSMPDIEY